MLHTVSVIEKYSDRVSGEFGSIILDPGDSYEFLFTEAVTLNYHCMPHPWMQGTITVE